MKLILNVFAFLLCLTCFAQESSKYSPNDLESWASLGTGKGFVTHGQFFMEESEGSKGFMILSPNKYKDVILRFEIMTLNAATVMVNLLNASDIGESTDLSLKENSDSFGYWTKEAEDYMFGYRVMAHNNTPFLRKHPAEEGKSTTLFQAPADVMHTGWRHLVECGKRGQKIWLKIDGKTIIDFNDDNPLDAGKLAIRVRGTANELGKCMLRNVEITGDAVE